MPPLGVGRAGSVISPAPSPSPSPSRRSPPRSMATRTPARTCTAGRARTLWRRRGSRCGAAPGSHCRVAAVVVRVAGAAATQAALCPLCVQSSGQRAPDHLDHLGDGTRVCPVRLTTPLMTPPPLSFGFPPPPQIASLIGADPKEIVFTSGAPESNNLAIKGIAGFYKDKKRHVITTQTEHKCVLDSCRCGPGPWCGRFGARGASPAVQAAWDSAARHRLWYMM